MNKTSKINYPDELPIVACRDEIIEAITKHNIVIISGETGSGSTGPCSHVYKGGRMDVFCKTKERDVRK